MEILYLLTNEEMGKGSRIVKSLDEAFSYGFLYIDVFEDGIHMHAYTRIKDANNNLTNPPQYNLDY